MSNENTIFTQLMLREAPAAKKVGVQVPKRITALHADRHYFFVEADGVKGEYVSADNAYDAKAEYIFKLIDRAGKGSV